jgi:demethoxyubiquinone hydroxylase (CLK1/Coq7/Cat5 family)
MLGFGHQTVFGLCLALVSLAGISIVFAALLYVERQDVDLLQEHISSLRNENSQLRAELADYRDGRHAQQQAAVQSAD